MNNVQHWRNEEFIINRLFADWLMELKEDASSKGLKAQYTYAKALHSLTKYPLPLASADDCKMLDGFGNKICQMLDERLQRYSMKDKKLNKLEETTILFDSHRSGTKRVCGGKRSFHGSEYIPRVKSGAYALLMTLYRHTQHNIDEGYLLKRELMEDAQPLTEHSFSVPLPGSHYTAWSSMGTLIAKGLVTRVGSPAKYRITSSGLKIAKMIIEANEMLVEKNTYLSNADVQLSKQATMPISCPAKAVSDSTILLYHSDQKMCIDGVCYESQSTDDDGHLVSLCNVGTYLSSGYMDNVAAEPVIADSRSHGCGESIFASLRSDDAMAIGNSVTISNVEELDMVEKHINASANEVVHDYAHSLAFSEPNCLPVKTVECNQSEMLIDSDANGLISSTRDRREDLRIATDSVDFCAPDCVMDPGSFQIILCVDNQEYFSSGFHNRELMIKELDNLGIVYHVRRLQVGDFVWVARRSSGGNDCRSGVELVLDYIVERKRMDDLSSSIIDGRFKEQKHRLLNCGIYNVIYLVEEYGSTQQLSIPEDSLQQAIINTQVTDGLFIKKTRDTKQSAAYLASVTHYLHNVYSKKTLLGYKHCVEQHQDCASFSASVSKLLTFEVFNNSSVKTKALTISEMFGKHLMQLNGLTPEKTAVVLEHYSCPYDLLQAYDCCETDQERRQLFAGLKFGAAKRCFGTQLSKTLSLLYYTNGTLL